MTPSCRSSSYLLIMLGLLLVIHSASGVGPRSSAKASKKIGTVYERNLVKESINAQSIVKENKKYHPETAKYKRFNAPTLVYVTPWNSHGYDVAKIFNAKFTYVAPVWYQIKFERTQGQMFLTGRHDVDQGWIADVRANHNSTAPPNIVPRFIMEGWSLEDYQLLLSEQKMSNALIDLVVQECIRQNFDGIVLEHGYGLNNQLSSFMIGMANQLHEHNKKLILVIPADKGSQGQHITSTLFTWLAEYIDGFSLMTYDFSSAQRPGPTAPLSWVTQSVMRLLPPDHKSSGTNLGHKILMGMAFYGYEYWEPSSAEPIIGPNYIKTLAAYKPKMTWHSQSHEHSFTYQKNPGEDRTVYYPTLKSVADRLSLAEDLGVGLSIWEIGQGLDYFYDLL